MGLGMRFVLRRAAMLGVAVVAARTGHWLFATGWLFALFGLYWYSVRALGDVPCWLCGGSGSRGHRGLLAWLWGRSVDNCLRCHGNKVNPRWGRRMLGPRA